MPPRVRPERDRDADGEQRKRGEAIAGPGRGSSIGTVPRRRKTSTSNSTAMAATPHGLSTTATAELATHANHAPRDSPRSHASRQPPLSVAARQKTGVKLASREWLTSNPEHALTAAATSATRAADHCRTRKYTAGISNVPATAATHRSTRGSNGPCPSSSSRTAGSVNPTNRTTAATVVSRARRYAAQQRTCGRV